MLSIQKIKVINEDEFWRSGQLIRSTAANASNNLSSSTSPAYYNSKQSSNFPHQNQNSVTSGAGDIIDTEHGFTIQLNAKHFQPNDIQITLHDHTLNVFGDRLEDSGLGEQKLRRSFTRKYTIPSDVRISSISSYMTSNGLLIIKGSRKGWKETDLRQHLAPNSSVISTV
ncbi:unnamed protein product [Thelazia callipaeda]|uniref:SHSP domain-containing protein n=1 Tax=Thelazia callipaeda TaxID=103827 RepID=A0A0N5D3G9_THECL|nr:unnamed protein product [Thelazia callipaeda]